MQVPEANSRVLLIGTVGSEHRRILEHFSENGLSLDLADVDREALPLLRLLPAYDVVILPLSERTQEGLELLREVRRHFVPSRVLVLVQADADAVYQQYCLDAFERGADDCARHSCPPLEIYARIQVLQRRSNHRPVRPSVYHFGSVRVDFHSRSVTSSKETFVLTRLEGRLLHFLIEHEGRSVHREQLLREVWEVFVAFGLASPRQRLAVQLVPSNQRRSACRSGSGYQPAGVSTSSPPVRP